MPALADGGAQFYGKLHAVIADIGDCIQRNGVG
jgi:hypothetical protein